MAEAWLKTTYSQWNGQGLPVEGRKENEQSISCDEFCSSPDRKKPERYVFCSDEDTIMPEFLNYFYVDPDCQNDQYYASERKPNLKKYSDEEKSKSFDCECKDSAYDRYFNEQKSIKYSQEGKIKCDCDYQDCAYVGDRKSRSRKYYSYKEEADCDCKGCACDCYAYKIKTNLKKDYSDRRKADQDCDCEDCTYDKYSNKRGTNSKIYSDKGQLSFEFECEHHVYYDKIKSDSKKYYSYEVIRPNSGPEKKSESKTDCSDEEENNSKDYTNSDERKSNPGKFDDNSDDEKSGSKNHYPDDCSKNRQTNAEEDCDDHYSAKARGNNFNNDLNDYTDEKESNSDYDSDSYDSDDSSSCDSDYSDSYNSDDSDSDCSDSYNLYDSDSYDSDYSCDSDDSDSYNLDDSDSYDSYDSDEYDSEEFSSSEYDSDGSTFADSYSD